MFKPLYLTLLVLLAALAPASVAASPSQIDDERPETVDAFEYCGDVRPVFLNPDLRPRDDGFVHASGWFFIQFQVITDGPDVAVDRLGFSFGKPIPDGARTCDGPAWITDAYYKDYRVDDDPSDGFFIPINTTNVPDGEYAAAISIYAGGEEIGRMFTRAIVENGCQVAGCQDRSTEEIIANDLVRPWPIVLPGDGQAPGGGLTVEFGEPVTHVRATVDGEPVELEEIEPRTWDDDTWAAAIDEDAPACPHCNDRAWGPAYRWDGQVSAGAVVAIHAEDLNRNTVSKIVHISSSTVSGVISVQTPELEIRVPEANKQSEPGQAAEFEVVFQNVGKDTAHTNLHLEAPEGVEASWEPNHVMVDSGEEARAVLTASAAEAGTYEIDAWAAYKAGADEVRKQIPLTLQVGEGSSEESSGGNQSQEALNTSEVGTTGQEDDENGVPLPGVGLILGSLLLSVALRSRTRRPR